MELYTEDNKSGVTLPLPICYVEDGWVEEDTAHRQNPLEHQIAHSAVSSLWEIKGSSVSLMAKSPHRMLFG